ncbi:uncharacterized protein B0H18DRAFT_1112679 [Fomitopsis serialis]|uniref:uncharacterized protein n=1 Tax=Fomitopsis serialis TaxID=139415 RepID=UPI002007B4D2|nr:uncharacterized protein B0H18DRAFT_1112679 [Neoantrodia serialis]KAH9938535.1 hypothetical protein B0H18DRAFT_1112679 [Neoantrodia serialis]
MAISRSRRHKEPAPRLRILSKRKRGSADAYALRRAMTEEERELWASPYLRMLSTPLRVSAVGERHLPTAFLIRLSAKRVPGPHKAIVNVVPDTLEHPAYRHQRPGSGVYIPCRGDAIRAMKEKSVERLLHHSARVQSGLEEQISHLLRVRVLQELRILVQRLRRKPWGATDAPLLRRLTRTEWKELQASGTIPQEDAAAVLVVPPVNRNPATNARPEPSMSSLPLPSAEAPSKDRRPQLPVSTLMPTTTSGAFEDDELSVILPQSKVPLYNGVALFPSPQQRAACHKSLTELQGHPNAASEETRLPEASGRVRGDEKGSHAFLLRSNAKTLLRADTVPLAVALWRLRMWEGQGWDIEGPEYLGPWGAH